MDHDAFDRLARLLGTSGSRRAALGALLGSSVLGAAESAFAKKRGQGTELLKRTHGGHYRGASLPGNSCSK